MKALARFDDRTLWRGAVVTATASVLMAVVGSAFAVARVPGDELMAGWLPQNAFAVLIFAPVLLLTARAQPRNRVVWAVGVATLLSGLQVVGNAVATIRINDEVGSVASRYAPADLTVLTAAVEWSQVWSWVPIVVLLGPLLLLWFPDGALPSRRWRPVEWMAVAAMTLIVAGLMIASWPSVTVPYDEAIRSGPVALLLGVGYPLLGLTTLLAFVSVVRRARRADGMVRRQIRTLGYGAAVFGLITAVSLVVDPWSTVFQVTVVPAIVILAGAFAVAIGRYRLFDIDVVINRTVVFGLLAAFVTAVYTAIVVGIGTLLGDPSNPVLAIGATALVAVLFEPVRAGVQHWANVVAYGRRATPYEVLAYFADQLRQPALDPDQQVGQLARLLADGTGARRAVVWLAIDGRLEPAAVAPSDADAPPPADAVDAVTADAVVPVTLDGDQLGALSIDARRGGEVAGVDRRVLGELAGQAALVLGNARLRGRLRARLTELTGSRRRLVQATDDARRRLERNLHDGAQQQLVAVKVKLGLARTVAGREGADQVAAHLERIAAEADAAVDELRELARGIYPPLLESEGLAVALQAQARKAPLPVTVAAGDVGRHPREIEACVYFCVVEALANVVRHADATRAEVTLRQADGSLEFAVTDDGRGFDPERTPRGSGLLGMADRLDTVDGRLDVDADPGRGVTVVGTVPVRVAADA